LMGDLSSEGRMARILIKVPDPLDLDASGSKRPPLLIGEYVRVEIEGRKLDNVFQVPRTAVRDNSSIWIVGENQTLEIRSVHPVWRDADIVLLQDGLKSGERLIVSDLAAAVEAMALRVDTPVSKAKKEPPTKKEAK
jgi:multidrug efflux pump subunit AcrA (membrane-fusion protein)